MIKQYLFTFILLAAIAPIAFTQNPQHKGILLYKEGKYAEAASLLDVALKDRVFKTDAEMWKYLGLSRLALNDLKAARKAFEEAAKRDPMNAEHQVNLAYTWMKTSNTSQAKKAASKAIKLNPKLASPHYLRGAAYLWENKFDDADRDALRAIELNPAFAQAYVLRSDIVLARLSSRLEGNPDPDALLAHAGSIKNAADILRAGKDRVADADKLELEQVLSGMDAFYEYFSKDRTAAAATPQANEPGVKPLTVISKPRALYTDRARQANIQGTVRVAVLFGATGRIEHVLLLKKLGHRLDQEAIKAARQIKFEPKMKDGAPIATVRTLEYAFSIY